MSKPPPDIDPPRVQVPTFENRNDIPTIYFDIAPAYGVMSGIVQVELGGEATKSGLTEAALMPALETLRALAHLRVEGLMTIPPPAGDHPEAARPFFRRLRECRDRAQAEGLLQGGTLSMGMSDDYEIAIEEGATVVRVGSALFGERTYA